MLRRFGYPFALAVTIVPVLLVVAVVTVLGREARGVELGSSTTDAPAFQDTAAVR